MTEPQFRFQPHEMTDSELLREIAKHRDALEHLPEGTPVDRDALAKHLAEYVSELENRKESRKRPLGAAVTRRGVYHSVFDSESGH